MNNLNETTVHKIEEVLKYISVQEKHLQEVEKLKVNLITTIFQIRS